MIPPGIFVGASRSHMESKALKTSASLAQVVALVQQQRGAGGAEAQESGEVYEEWDEDEPPSE